MDKLIINAAITGMVPMKSDNPHVPINAEEIAEDVRRCRDAGASIVHIHARDESQQPTYHKEAYEEILRSVREVCPDIILCVSTSGRTFKAFEQRSKCLEAIAPAPEMASLTLGSMNFPKVASVNSPDMIKSLALKMQELNVVPEWECFDLGMVEYSHYLIKHGILKPPFYCNILLGSLGTLGVSAFNLALAVNSLPKGVTWAAAGIGMFQFEANSLAIVMGGHVRVGLEDNIWYDDARTVPATNYSLIDRVVRLAKAAGREIATPDEAREIIGLPSPKLETIKTAAFRTPQKMQEVLNYPEKTVN